MTLTLSIVIGFLLDLLLGDPLWLPHPVVGIGRMIAFLERLIRRIFPATPRWERLGGVLLWLGVAGVTYGLTAGLLSLFGWIHPLLRFGAETFLCYQIFATRGLWNAGMAVYRELQKDDMMGARQAVSRIVGRDTETLDRPGITRAAVETVSENTNDGIVAPLFYLLLGGVPLGMLYKAVNTMDSMVGYKNERYLSFGWAAAKLDDLFNFLPARISGVTMVLAAVPAGLSLKGAWKIFCRDRLAHTSPNAAHTEAACAGALGVRLAGDARYFGKIVHKPTIGDDTRPIEPEDIHRSCRLMLATACLTLAIGVTVRVGAILWL